MRRTTSRSTAVCFFVASAAILTCPTAPAHAEGATGELVDRTAFRVCADPNYLPFSNDKGEGFEDKIAQLFAAELNVPVVYTWYPRSQGFVRNTLRARACDVIIGVVTGSELVQNTNPYYRSTYVMATRSDDAGRYPDLDAPAIKDARIGVVASTPPSDLLLRKGLLEHTKSYQLIVDTRAESPAADLMRDLATGRIDIALLWGPIAGYWAKQLQTPITLIPLAGGRERNLVMDFRISLGIRPGEPDWKHELDQLTRKLQPQISAILADYGVPLLDNQGRRMDPATLARPEARAASAVPEPKEYRTEDYKSPVPATLAGASVLDAAGLSQLIATAQPLLVDVLPRQPKPANRPEGSIWIDKQREDIPGSVWLPNVGFGYIPEATMNYFRRSLETLTGGDKNKSIVFYCDPNCWMSWNAAKRALIELGYRHIYWFPGGAAGWAAEGKPLVNASVYDPERAGLVQ